MNIFGRAMVIITAIIALVTYKPTEVELPELWVAQPEIVDQWESYHANVYASSLEYFDEIYANVNPIAVRARIEADKEIVQSYNSLSYKTRIVGGRTTHETLRRANGTFVYSRKTAKPVVTKSEFRVSSFLSILNADDVEW